MRQLTVREFRELLDDHARLKREDGQRLGQRFVNRYVENDPYPSLFYADDGKAIGILYDHHVDWQNLGE